jgi:hypothetical protein
LLKAAGHSLFLHKAWFEGACLCTTGDGLPDVQGTRLSGRCRLRRYGTPARQEQMPGSANSSRPQCIERKRLISLVGRLIS